MIVFYTYGFHYLAKLFELGSQGGITQVQDPCYPFHFRSTLLNQMRQQGWLQFM